MDLRNSSKWGVGVQSCDIPFENMLISHTVSLAVLMYACHFCHALAYAMTANGVFFCLLGPPLRFL